MGIDQWLVRQLMKALHVRYGYAVRDELVKWQTSAETARRVQLLAQLGGYGIDVKLDEGVQILAPQHVTIGSHVAIGRYSILRAQGGITLDDFALLGDYVVLATAGHPLGEVYINNTHTAPIVIGENAWLAAGCIITPGVTVGENAVVGAGAVVTDDVPPNRVVGGVPARVIKTLHPDDEFIQAQKDALRTRRARWKTRPR